MVKSELLGGYGGAWFIYRVAPEYADLEDKLNDSEDPEDCVQLRLQMLDALKRAVEKVWTNDSKLKAKYDLEVIKWGAVGGRGIVSEIDAVLTEEFDHREMVDAYGEEAALKIQERAAAVLTAAGDDYRDRLDKALEEIYHKR